MVLGFTGLIPQLIVGLVSVIIIVFSAEKVVEKMQSVAKTFGISEVAIAVTIISIGTSLPEISVHLVGSLNILSSPASMNQISGTVLGMNIGSDVIQQTLIMGTIVILASKIKGRNEFIFTRRFLRRDYLAMILAHLLVLLLALNGILSRLEGFLLISAFLLYLYVLYLNKDENLLRSGDSKPSERPYKDLAIGLTGMIILVYFSDIFLKVVETLVLETGLSGSMIGVTTIGVVSAMPEFITAVSALRKGAEGLSLGTLIGSNITNPLMGIGIGAALSSYAVPKVLVTWDLPVQIVTAVSLVFYLWNKERIGDFLASFFKKIGWNKAALKVEKWENGVLTFLGGLLLILIYLIYLVVRANYFQVDF